MLEKTDYASDLHFDNGMGGGPFGWFGTISISKWVNDGAKVLLIAGDTANHGDDAIDFFNMAAQYYEHVIAIFGNHEEKGINVPANNVHLLENGPFWLNDVVFVGGEYATVTDEDIASIKIAESDPRTTEVIILSHFVPDARVGDDLVDMRGKLNMQGKANDLIVRLGPPKKATTIIFGHSHIECVAEVGGYRCISNPRGYRGLRRDKTVFKRFAKLAGPFASSAMKLSPREGRSFT